MNAQPIPRRSRATVAQLIQAAGDLLDPDTDGLPPGEIRRRIARFYRLRAACRQPEPLEAESPDHA
jgi:hypothetical protein